MIPAAMPETPHSRHHVDEPQALVTLALVAYNQAAYVEMAIASALAQTYSPLEIILSDDASTDETATIIRNMASTYSGPHRLTVNVNDHNLGIGAHVNKMFHMARGQLVVMFAGDDISSPDRVSKTFDAWDAGGKTRSAIFCGADIIDSDGLVTGKLDQRIRGERRDAKFIIRSIHRDYSVVLGACSAYVPTVMTKFGDLEDTLGIEDTPLAVRASLLGGIEYIDEPLVQYRTNVSVWRTRRSDAETFGHHRHRLVHVAQSLFQVFNQILIDASKFGDRATIAAAKRRFVASRFVIRCHDAGKFSIMAYLRSAIGSGQWIRPLLLGVMFAFPRFHHVIFRCKKRINAFLNARIRG